MKTGSSTRATQTVIAAKSLLQRLNQMDFIKCEYGDMPFVFSHQIPGLLVDE